MQDQKSGWQFEDCKPVSFKLNIIESYKKKRHVSHHTDLLKLKPEKI